MRFLLLSCALSAILMVVGDAQIIKAISCPAKITSAMIGKCKTRLDEHLDLVDKSENDLNHVAPSMIRCCYFAEYVHCVVQEAREECGELVNQSVEERVMKMYGTLNSRCDDYTINSPTCIIVVWFDFILSAALVGLVLIVGCCIGACLCR